ncbi:phytanoyl-CoA dioxygenase family protein [Trujillonella humicola]|uniref:phytanoyl-CoA dioxygenase family protein n=1 Tax=Trujillonella humicola TaxID=3383699 RepID=UPI0039063191
MRLTKAEWTERAGQPDFQEQLLLALRTDGYFLLEEVFDRARMQEMTDDFAGLLEDHRAKTPDNRGKNRYNIQLPVRPPFVAPDIQTNELLYPLLKKVLGEDLAVSFMAADTPLEGSEYQIAHSDGIALFPGLDTALPAFNLVLNILLVDFTPENGPLEIFPYGTHHLDWSDAAAGSQLREAQQVIAPAGSVIIRDARMWHRGTPNRTPDMRPMMAVAYSRSWYRFSEAEVGMMPLKVDQAQYESWGKDMQHLFRFAHVENDVNAPVVVGAVADRIATLLVPKTA